MTKHRAPFSLDAALARIAGHLPGGWAEMADLVTRKERTVRNWGDPDTAEMIPMDCALQLDVAYQAAGGIGAPIYEAYGFRLELACTTRFADLQALGRHAAAVIKETGEASAALVLASQPGATPRDRLRAAREVEEALDVLRRAVPYLEAADRAPLPEAQAQPP